MSFTSITAKVTISALGVLVSAGGVGLINTQSRVAVLEAHRQDDNARLERIENKIDQLMEHAGVHAPAVAKNESNHE